MVIIAGFPTANCRKWYKFRLFVHIFNIRCTIFFLETRYFSCCLLYFIKWQIYKYIFIENNNKKTVHGNEWMEEHNCALQNADTRPRLQSRTQNICFVISISAVILKLMVKITSIFGSYRFLRIAWHDIFSLSHHLLASWSLYIPRVAKSKCKCSSSRQV